MESVGSITWLTVLSSYDTRKRNEAKFPHYVMRVASEFRMHMRCVRAIIVRAEKGKK